MYKKVVILSTLLSGLCPFWTQGFPQTKDKGYRSVELVHKGHIRGEVTYSGPAIELPSLTITKDQNVCGSEPRPLKAIDVGSNGALRNAVVYITDIKRGKPFAPVTGPAILDQKGCAYHPHVQVVPERSTLKILNEDNIWHNVHAYLFPYDTQFVLYPNSLPAGGKTLFNRAMINVVKKIVRNLPESGIIKFACDAGHSWMTAYIIVAEHPYFVKVDERGHFEIKDVPVGTYEIAVWHEYFGTQVKEVQVSPNIYQRVNFEY